MSTQAKQPSAKHFRESIDNFSYIAFDLQLQLFALRSITNSKDLAKLKKQVKDRYQKLKKIGDAFIITDMKVEQQSNEFDEKQVISMQMSSHREQLEESNVPLNLYNDNLLQKLMGVDYDEFFSLKQFYLGYHSFLGMCDVFVGQIAQKQDFCIKSMLRASRNLVKPAASASIANSNQYIGAMEYFSQHLQQLVVGSTQLMQKIEQKLNDFEDQLIVKSFGIVNQSGFLEDLSSSEVSLKRNSKRNKNMGPQQEEESKPLSNSGKLVENFYQKVNHFQKFELKKFKSPQPIKLFYQAHYMYIQLQKDRVIVQGFEDDEALANLDVMDHTVIDVLEIRDSYILMLTGSFMHGAIQVFEMENFEKEKVKLFPQKVSSMQMWDSEYLILFFHKGDIKLFNFVNFIEKDLGSANLEISVGLLTQNEGEVVLSSDSLILFGEIIDNEYRSCPEQYEFDSGLIDNIVQVLPQKFCVNFLEQTNQLVGIVDRKNRINRIVYFPLKMGDFTQQVLKIKEWPGLGLIKTKFHLFLMDFESERLVLVTHTDSNGKNQIAVDFITAKQKLQIWVFDTVKEVHHLCRLEYKIDL